MVLFGDPAASDRILAQLQKVTAADVQRVAKSIMDDSHAVTLRYLPQSAGAKGDTIADSKAIEAVKVDIPAAEVPAMRLHPRISARRPLRPQPP